MTSHFLAGAGRREHCVGLGHDLVAEDRSQTGDAGGDPDLAEGRVRSRGHATSLERDNGHRCRRQGRVDQADPYAGQDEAGEQLRPTRRPSGHPHKEHSCAHQ